MEAIIKEVYESNFGTAYETYKEAVKKDNSTRLQDVKDYLSKRDDIQVKSKTKSYNSFVSPGAKFEFEIDLMDIETKGATSNTRYGLVAIDNFNKIDDVVTKSQICDLHEEGDFCATYPFFGKKTFS